MGWLIYNHTPRDIKAEIERLCTYEDEVRAARPLRASRVGTVWYVAVEVQLKRPDGETYGHEADAMGRYVFAAVFLTRRENGGWGYKSMDEGQGPVESQAPLAILNLLSPTTTDYALAWRQRCREHAAKASRKLTHGDVIELAQPLEFTDGRQRSRFTVHKGRNPGEKRVSTSFICAETGAHCRISGVMKRDWKTVG
ncbi:hypothetical protein EU803_15560 [Loktanella sp. IMCC34160]|uniref:DUF6927 domain-containing protein n=1 Tax=Loktanella sp. IMCC34160 TaxID=2510646 RepID=UPI00101BF637|nr:hypothetical protein [Loktanella sp. IMCC34160]RYG90030.1 hypothetical protein EU803_15560 [Loktanella sp. IMCC34160]